MPLRPCRGAWASTTNHQQENSSHHHNSRASTSMTAAAALPLAAKFVQRHQQHRQRQRQQQLYLLHQGGFPTPPIPPPTTPPRPTTTNGTVNGTVDGTVNNQHQHQHRHRQQQVQLINSPLAAELVVGVGRGPLVQPEQVLQVLGRQRVHLVQKSCQPIKTRHRQSRVFARCGKGFSSQVKRLRSFPSSTAPGERNAVRISYQRRRRRRRRAPCVRSSPHGKH